VVVVGHGHRVKASDTYKAGIWFPMNQCSETNTGMVKSFVDNQVSFREGVSDVTVRMSRSLLIWKPFSVRLPRPWSEFCWWAGCLACVVWGR
jgi:hypothetical protein